MVVFTVLRPSWRLMWTHILGAPEPNEQDRIRSEVGNGRLDLRVLTNMASCGRRSADRVTRPGGPATGLESR